jgi:glycosyltransferase involved in cell wall biosynthesis
MKVGLFCPNIKAVCGRSKAVLLLAKGLNEQNIQIILFTNKESDLLLINRYGFKSIIIPINPFSKSIFNCIQSIFLIKKYANKYELDLVHTHHRYVELLAYFAQKIFRLNFKLITTVHSLVSGYHFLSFRSAKVISVSKFVEKHLINFYKLDREKFSVIPNGIEIPTEFKYLKSGKIILLGFGRFEYEKGFDILIKAAAKLKSYSNEIVIKLVGEGIEKNNYYNLSKSLNIDVEIFKNDDTPWDEINNAKIIIVPSRVEALGLSVLESGAMGKCVVASNVGGIPEIIENEHDGLLFESENADDLFNKLKDLLDNKYKIEHYGKNLKTKIEKYFLMDRMTESYIKEYRQLINYNNQ